MVRRTKREIAHEKSILRMAYRYGKRHHFQALTKKGLRFIGKRK